MKNGNEAFILRNCVGCGEFNHLESELCNKCGLILASEDAFCSICKEPVRQDDSRCYSCGTELNIKPEMEIKDEVSNIDRGEKEKFKALVRNKAFRVNIEYFMDNISLSLKLYSTAKILFSKECPKEVLAFYNIKDGNLEEKLEQLAKNFFTSLRNIFIGERFARISLSSVAFFLNNLPFQEVAKYRGLLLLLKTESKYNESMFDLSEDIETTTYLYKKIIVSSVLQEIIFKEQENYASMLFQRAVKLFELAEEINNRGRLSDFERFKVINDEIVEIKREITILPETVHLYENSFERLAYAATEYFEREQEIKAIKTLELLQKEITRYVNLLPSESIVKILDTLLTYFGDLAKSRLKFEKEKGKLSEETKITIEVVIKIFTQIKITDDEYFEMKKKLLLRDLEEFI